MQAKDMINENIIELLGLRSLPEEKKIAMLQKMSELIQKRVILKIMENLSSEDGEKMAAMENNPQEMLAYIAEKFPNFEAMVKDEVVKLKQEVLAAAEQA